MAIRVRKLAKEVRRSPGEVLGLLHQLGYLNYSRPEDMVADLPADKLRRAVKQGKTAAPVAVSVAPAARSSAAPASGGGDDLMAQLVPGVVKQGAPPPPPLPPPAPPRPAPAPPAAADTSAEVEALLAEVETLVAQRDALQARVDALQARTDVLEAERASLVEARQAAEAAMNANAASPDGILVGEVLEGRGLRGRDELVRALQALLGFRRGGAILDARLAPRGAAELQRDAAELMLLDGTPPAELTVPAIAVGDDRADAPGAESLDRLLRELSEHMLLSGWRRLALVGVPPRWHGAIGGRLDRRIEVAFQPAGTWSAEQVRGLEADLVGAVGLSVEDEAVLAASPATWVRDDSLAATLRRLVRVARGDEG